MAPSSTPANVTALLPKLNDADADIRYMSLSDLNKTLINGAPSFLISDFIACTKAVEGLLKTLDDTNGEVQNQAIKCLGALVLKIPTEMLAPLVEKLTNLTTTNSLDNSIRTAALRTFITAFDPPVSGVAPSKGTQDAYNTISKVLIPRLVGYVVISQGPRNLPPPPRGMLEVGPKSSADSDAIDVLIDTIRSFGPMLQDVEKQALQKSTLNILDSERTGIVIKKKAVTAMSTLALYLPDRLLGSFISSTIQSFRNKQVTAHKRRLLITVVGSLARSVPQRLGPYLTKLAPFVLNALSQQDYDEYQDELADAGTSNPEIEELHEAALVALEGFLACCSHEMRPYTEEAIDAALRYVAHDPNMADEDDEEMGGTQQDSDDELEANGMDSNEDDEDFEEEGGMSDDDDVSWKVRRCAAKVLYTIISRRSNGDLLDNGVLYGKIAPVLIKRFHEREENVRLEILAALALLITKTGRGLPSLHSEKSEFEAQQSGLSQSRKRRRPSTSDDSFDSHGIVQTSMGVNSPIPSPPPASGPKADLARSRFAIVQGVIRLLKQGSTPTKQAGLSLLRDLVLVQNGALSDQLTNVVDRLIDAINLTAGSTFIGIAGAGSQLRIDALLLTGTICDTHPSKIIAPYLGKLVPAVVAAATERTFKVSSQALSTVESLVKVLTPPRSASHQQQYRSYIGDLYNAILDRATATDADLEVRQRAIHALGVLLARTPGNVKLLSSTSRTKGLSVLLDRMRNETTRLIAAQAVDITAASITEKDDVQKLWVRNVVLELAGQFRKSDRTLKGASLITLRNMLGNRAVVSCLDTETTHALSGMLLPVINPTDLNTLGLALMITTRLVQSSPQTVVDNNLTNVLCTVVVAPLSGAVLETFLNLVKAIGDANFGQSLMKGLLNVGITGDPAIVGKAIGTLLVAGGQGVGVTIEAFIRELQTTSDDARKCLALYILGEVGLRLGPKSPLNPELFQGHFISNSETVPRAAAIAFGRAGAGNINVYLPAILSNAKRSGNAQYLSLHAIKEILQYAGKSEANISPYIRQIWERLLSASKAEDNKAIGAECIGRLTVMEPKTFLPLIQNLLRDPDATTRGMVIQAFRFTFADGDESFDMVLKPMLTKMLSTMLKDTNLDNRRLALSTLNSATRNKPDFVLPDLPQLIPLVMDDSRIKPALIREVQMGPFKHKVDDGLEVRKSAYETLYSLMKNAFSRISTLDLFDRVVAGIEDEHEIKVLCNLMLTELMVLDADETSRRLDSIAEAFKRVLSFKPKENAVKQELEKLDEARNGVLKVSVALHTAFPNATSPTSTGQAPIWSQYWDWIWKENRAQLLMLEADLRVEAP